MPDGFNIAGTNVPKPVAYGGGALVLIGGVYYYRKQKAQKATAQAGQSQTDPATGYPYGSPEDAAALQAQSQYVSPTGFGIGGTSGGSGAFGQGQPGQFINDAEWAQYVEQYEINNLGADAPTVSDAIGKYINGQPLPNANEVSLVQSAIAIAGYPPVAGANGNPPNYITSSTTPNPSTAPSGTIVPPGKPPPIQPGGPGITVTPTSVTGLHITNHARTSIGIAWSPSHGATRYAVRTTYQGGLVRESFTNSTSFSITGLSPNRTYGIHVIAINGNNWSSETSIDQKTDA